MNDEYEIWCLKHYYQTLETVKRAIGLCNKLSPGESKKKNISRLFKRLNQVKSNIRYVESGGIHYEQY